MTLSDALEFFKKGYKECFNLSDIKKSENHLHRNPKESSHAFKL